MFVLGAGKSVIATDVLWSDPAPEPGLVENEARGVGLLFGPDVTQVATSTCHCCPCSAMQAMIEACRAKIEQICVRKKYITLFAGTCTGSMQSQAVFGQHLLGCLLIVARWLHLSDGARFELLQ